MLDVDTYEHVYICMYNQKPKVWVLLKPLTDTDIQEKFYFGLLLPFILY